MALFAGENVFQEIARELDGHYVERELFGADRSVTQQFHDWQIKLDTYVVSTGNTSIAYTRIRAGFQSKEDWDVRISSPARFLAALGKMLGGQRISTGDTLFDENFVVKGYPEERVRAFLENERVRTELIGLECDSFALNRKDKLIAMDSGHYREDISAVVFQMVGEEKDRDQLLGMFALIRASLVQLYALANNGYQLEPGEQPLLSVITAALENEFGWLSATTERRGAGLLTRFRSPVSSLDLDGELYVSAPQFPVLDCNVELGARIPDATIGGDTAADSTAAEEIRLHTPTSFGDKVSNLRDFKVGHKIVDERFVISAPDSEPDKTREFLLTIAPLLERLAAHKQGEVQLKITNDFFQVRLTRIQYGDVTRVSQDFVSIWQRICEWRLAAC